MRLTHLAAAITLSLALIITGCSGANAPTAGKPSATADASTGRALPDVVGKTGDEAQKELTAAGWTVKFDAGTDSVWKPSNWTVDAQDPAAGVSAPSGTAITLKVHKTSESTEGTAPATATDAERATALQQSLNDAFGGQTAADLLAADPTTWPGYVNGIRVERGNAYFTLQIAPGDPTRDSMGKSAAQALSTLLPAAAVTDIGWIIVEDAGHVVIDQKQPHPLS